PGTVFWRKRQTWRVRASPSIGSMPRGATAAAAVLVCLSGCGASQSKEDAETARCIQQYARTRTEPSHFAASWEGSIPHATTVSWEGPVWPPLPKTQLEGNGSGVASYRYRYRLSLRQ